MKPKPLNWYMIAWIDGPPHVGLCLDADLMEFLLLEDGDMLPIEEIGQDQIIKHLGEVKAPSLSASQKQFRLERKIKKTKKTSKPVNMTTLIRGIVGPLVKVFTMYNDARSDGSRRLKFISGFGSLTEKRKAAIQRIAKAELKANKVPFKSAEWRKSQNAWQEFVVIY